MERKQDIENSGFMPQKGNPLHETVTYKIGGTIFEVSTICGGSELLYSKMERLIKAESVKTPTDKEKETYAFFKAMGGDFTDRSFKSFPTGRYDCAVLF